MNAVVSAPVDFAEYNQRASFRESAGNEALWAILDQVKDPEIPVISIWDLGILQDIYSDDTQFTVVITPTYSGCPAMREIEKDILSTMEQAGYHNVEVVTRLAPAWTTDWMSPDGLERLRKFGISPPQPLSEKNPPCPQCQSSNTVLISEFGSTACKALYKCKDCLEPFDYFKCI